MMDWFEKNRTVLTTNEMGFVFLPTEEMYQAFKARLQAESVIKFTGGDNDQ